MHYHTVFDVAQTGYRSWWFPAIGLFIAGFIGILTAIIPKQPRAIRDAIRFNYPIIPIIIALLWSAVSFVFTFSDYWKLRQALLSHQYRIVAGQVTEFIPQTNGDHEKESFTVNDRHYSYSFATFTASFNQTHSHGGPMKDGLKVRLADVNGQIARLEVAE